MCSSFVSLLESSGAAASILERVRTRTFNGDRTALIVEAAHVWLSLMLLTTALILAVLIVVFWRTLAWGNRVLDPLFPLGSVVVCALINYIAFIARGSVSECSNDSLDI